MEGVSRICSCCSAVTLLRSRAVSVSILRRVLPIVHGVVIATSAPDALFHGRSFSIPMPLPVSSLGPSRVSFFLIFGASARKRGATPLAFRFIFITVLRFLI